LVEASPVDHARQAAHVLEEVVKERVRRRPQREVIDVAVEGLLHSEDELRHRITAFPLASSRARFIARAISRSCKAMAIFCSNGSRANSRRRAIFASRARSNASAVSHGCR